ncbi:MULTISPECIES: hypothetical protein [Rhodobacterales]|uniref:hypothetical protein n=1 Tax=Rhodobacterales TaxID=204455 RepID=UPI0015EFFB27|nr:MULTISPECIES: hypothetical protein [Rhodobacterales]MDO6589914.1 hypothetical protein [Yoonia sp. 1_MG-2023]
MNQSTQRVAPHEAAAKSFYGQSEEAFNKQVEQLAINDPRLIAVFQNTRAHYQNLTQN